MLKPVIKPLVYVRFMDHASNNAADVRPIVCEVFGILKKQDKLSYTIVSWICDYNLSDHNSDGYCILKSTVVEYREINPGRPNGRKNEVRHRKGKSLVRKGATNRK